MNITVNHTLSFEQALKCSKNIIDRLKEEHSDRITNLVQMWNGNISNFSFRIAGMNIDGTLTVFSDRIEIHGNLPAAAFLFKRMIEETIQRHAEKMLKNCPKS
jgi:hypothetical protein